MYPFLSNLVAISNVVQKVDRWESVRLLSFLIYVVLFCVYKEDWRPSETWILILYPENSLSFAQIHTRFSNCLKKKNMKNLCQIVHLLKKICDGEGK